MNCEIVMNGSGTENQKAARLQPLKFLNSVMIWGENLGG